MIAIFGWIAALATAALAPFFALMALITAAAFLARSRGGGLGLSDATGPARSRFLIVIPAHDEGPAIASTVRSCRALDYDPALFSIHVIADNCVDRTAAEAEAAGAHVVERSTPDLRSKGHALEYFFREVPAARPDSGTYDAAVLIDADTVVDPALLRAFDRDLAAGADWIQGYYTVRNPDASWRTRMLTLAFGLANGVWLLGLDRLGLGVGLKGNGMCFSAAGLRRRPWKAYGLVEDMEFALMLREAGERVRFDPDAIVRGEMVSRGGAGAASQRRRWEDGRKALRGRFGGALLRSRALAPGSKLAYLIELFFPPLANLTLGLGSALAASAIWGAGPGGPFRSAGGALWAIEGLMCGTLGAYALSPVAAMGLPRRYLASLLALPYYIAWKLVVGLGRKSKGWVRTPREARVDD